MEVNKIAPTIQEVIFEGGVIPHVPPYSSKSYVNDLRFLGWVKRKEGDNTVSEDMLEDKISTSYEGDFYEKHINNSERRKIVDLSDAYSVAEEQLKILMGVLPEDSVLRIQLGEEDKKNMDHIEQTYIKAWAKEKTAQIKELQKTHIEGLSENVENYALAKVNKECLQYALDLPAFKRGKKETKSVYSARIKGELTNLTEDSLESSIFIEDIEVKINDEKYEDSINDAVKYIAWASARQNVAENIGKSIKKKESSMAEFEKNKQGIEAKLNDLQNAGSWIDLLTKGPRGAVSWFTGQYPVRSDELELIFKKTKDEYTRPFYGMDLSQQILTHVSPRKKVTVDTGVISNIETGKKDSVDVEYGTLRMNGKNLLLVHNLNHIFSDNVSPKVIKDAKLESNYHNVVLSKLYKDTFKDEQPDIIMAGGHGAGGFRVMPWFKESEHMIDGEFVKGQDLAYLINLPTLQSTPQLEWLVSHGFKNWHTKRYKKGPYASAAVIHTEDIEGVNKFTIVDTAQLVEMGKVAEEIDVYRDQLKEKLTKPERKEILKIIKEKKNSIKLKYKKIEAAGDFHLGAPDHLDRYSKDELIQASQIYQREHGLPDIASWDEMLHGTLGFFGSASRYLGKPAVEFKRTVLDQILESDLSSEEKSEKIVQESLRNLRGITVHNEAMQKGMYAEMLRPYSEEVIKKGGKLILASGNHYNNSNKNSDEAIELANQYATALRDNGQVIPFSGKGNPVGVGSIRLENDRVLNVMHKFPEMQDEIYGMLNHLRKMNNDADIVIAGDRHQTGAGYADGHLVVLHPGFEAINKYVPLIGKPSGVRGFNNIFYDPNKKGVFSVDFVVNNTLEKVIDKNNII